jgi:ADP-ribose pyrophosphatase YjhB (NUDIX family)
VFLYRRLPDTDFAGTWALPGGKVENGESLAEAAQREITDKTGAHVRPPDAYLGAYSTSGYEIIVFMLACSRPDEAAMQKAHSGRWVQIAELEQSTDLAPNVRRACLDGLASVQAKATIRDLESIGRIVTPAKQALEKSFRPAGPPSAGGGWNHFLRFQEPGIMGTALALRSLAACGYPLCCPIVHSAQVFLKRAALPSGGWSSLLIRKTADLEEFAHTESTALALLGLTETGVDLGDEAVTRGIDWLLHNQLQNGGWELTGRSSNSRVLPTVLTLELIRNVAVSTPQWPAELSISQKRLADAYEKGVSWLVEAKEQRFPRWAELSFSEEPRQNPSIPHTALAAQVLLKHGHATVALALEAVDWLAELGPSQWKPALETVTVSSRLSEVIVLHWTHFSLPLCALAVAAAIKQRPCETYSRILLESASAIMKGQKTSGAAAGTWPHPDGSNREPVWAIRDCVAALQAIRESRPLMPGMDPWESRTRTLQDLEPLVLSDRAPVTIGKGEGGESADSREQGGLAGLIGVWTLVATAGTFGFLFLVFWELGAFPRLLHLEDALSELLSATIFAALGVALGVVIGSLRRNGRGKKER